MPHAIPRLARYTWARQWPAVLLLGLTQGVLWLNAFVAKRSLGARPEIVPFLLALSQIVWIFSPAVGPLMARANPQRAWWWLAGLQNAPLLLIALVAVEPVAGAAAGEGRGNLPLFLVAVFLFFTVSIAFVPHRGALLRTNYAPQVRGRMYGLVAAFTLFGAVVASKAVGWLLDSDPRWLRLVFPLAAVAGFAGTALHARIRWKNQRRAQPHRPVGRNAFRALRNAWRETVSTLREDKDFRTFETAYMIYGCGFLSGIPLLVLYAEEQLGLSYDSYTWAQGFSFPLALTLAAAPMGRLADRIGILRAASFAFLLLGAFFAAMPFVETVTGLVVAYTFFGIAMAGVDMGWSLGPLHFAPEGRAHMYAAIHFSLVGVRSIFAPFLGLAVKELFSYRVAFGLSTVLLVAAMATLYRLARRVH